MYCTIYSNIWNRKFILFQFILIPAYPNVYSFLMEKKIAANQLYFRLAL